MLKRKVSLKSIDITVTPVSYQVIKAKSPRRTLLVNPTSNVTGTVKDESLASSAIKQIS